MSLLLLIAALVAIATRRLRVPYSVGLVATGMFLAVFRVDPQLQLTRDLIFSILLPPLIFEAALALRWSDLRKDLAIIVALATVGVVLSAAVTAAGMWWLAGWSWTAACLFGALIAATDPVSVIALFKEAGVRGRLRTLIEAESLFNDATAAVLFAVAAAYTEGQSLTPGLLAVSLSKAIGAGMMCGVVVGGVVLFLTRRTGDHLVEVTLTAIGAYASFLLAEHFGGSGVLATLCAGLMIGNLAPVGTISSRGRLALETFWEFVAFVSNSL
ncbi:MAG TPA: cation:proton antiporter, partial [Burkholderiaceae bacterium]